MSNLVHVIEREREKERERERGRGRGGDGGSLVRENGKKNTLTLSKSGKFNQRGKQLMYTRIFRQGKKLPLECYKQEINAPPHM